VPDRSSYPAWTGHLPTTRISIVIAFQVLIFLLAAIGASVVIAIVWCAIFVPVDGHESIQTTERR
jgi:hypothetical protein